MPVTRVSFLVCFLWCGSQCWTTQAFGLLPSSSNRLPSSLTLVPSPLYTTSSIPALVRRKYTQLQSSTPEELQLHPKKEPLIVTYGVAHKLYTALGVLLLFIPGGNTDKWLPTKWGGAAGYLLAGQLCAILRTACRAGRLGSDTYKRLNVGLLAFGITWWAMPAEAGFVASTSSAAFLAVLLSAAKIFGVVLALHGWQYGVNPESGPGQDGIKLFGFVQPLTLARSLLEGTWDTLKGCVRVQYPKKALAYRNLFLLVVTGVMSTMLQGWFDIRYREAFDRSALDFSLEWSTLSRLTMISTMIYSLKDAAERDRLKGSTFIRLNVLVGSWAVFVGFAQGLQGFWMERLAFSLPFFIKAYKATLERKREKEEKQYIPTMAVEGTSGP